MIGLLKICPQPAWLRA